MLTATWRSRTTAAAVALVSSTTCTVQGHSASAMTAWVWGVSRIIDVLSVPGVGINLSAIGVTGCSRDGKGALMAGAFEPRIALTIPQESGSGGDACWRLSHFEKTSGSQVQDAVEIVTENVWLASGCIQHDFYL